MPDARFSLDVGTYLEIVYSSVNETKPTTLKVTYTKDGEDPCVLVFSEGADEATSNLPFIRFDEAQSGKLEIKAVFIDPDAAVTCEVHASPSISSRFHWSPGRVDGQPVPSPTNPVPRTAYILISVTEV